MQHMQKLRKKASNLAYKKVQKQKNGPNYLMSLLVQREQSQKSHKKYLEHIENQFKKQDNKQYSLYNNPQLSELELEQISRRTHSSNITNQNQQKGHKEQKIVGKQIQQELIQQKIEVQLQCLQNQVRRQNLAFDIQNVTHKQILKEHQSEKVVIQQHIIPLQQQQKQIKKHNKNINGNSSNLHMANNIRQQNQHQNYKSNQPELQSQPHQQQYLTKPPQQQQQNPLQKQDINTSALLSPEHKRNKQYKHHRQSSSYQFRFEELNKKRNTSNKVQRQKINIQQQNYHSLMSQCEKYVSELFGNLIREIKFGRKLYMDGHEILRQVWEFREEIRRLHQNNINNVNVQHNINEYDTNNQIVIKNHTLSPQHQKLKHQNIQKIHSLQTHYNTILKKTQQTQQQKIAKIYKNLSKQLKNRNNFLKYLLKNGYYQENGLIWVLEQIVKYWIRDKEYSAKFLQELELGERQRQSFVGLGFGQQKQRQKLGRLYGQIQYVNPFQDRQLILTQLQPLSMYRNQQLLQSNSIGLVNKSIPIPIPKSKSKQKRLQRETQSLQIVKIKTTASASASQNQQLFSQQRSSQLNQKIQNKITKVQFQLLQKQISNNLPKNLDERSVRYLLNLYKDMKSRKIKEIQMERDVQKKVKTLKEISRRSKRESNYEGRLGNDLGKIDDEELYEDLNQEDIRDKNKQELYINTNKQYLNNNHIIQISSQQTSPKTPYIPYSPKNSPSSISNFPKNSPQIAKLVSPTIPTFIVSKTHDNILRRSNITDLAKSMQVHIQLLENKNNQKYNYDIKNLYSNTKQSLMKWIQGKCKHVVMEDRYVINEDENNKEGDSIKNREYTYESQLQNYQKNSKKTKRIQTQVSIPVPISQISTTNPNPKPKQPQKYTHHLSHSYSLPQSNVKNKEKYGNNSIKVTNNGSIYGNQYSLQAELLGNKRQTQINYNSVANMSNINSRRMMRNNNNQKVILPQINPNQNKTPQNSLPTTPSTPQSPQQYSTHLTDKQKQQQKQKQRQKEQIRILRLYPKQEQELVLKYLFGIKIKRQELLRMLYSKDVVIQGFNGGIKTKGYHGNMGDGMNSNDKDKSKCNNKNKIFFTKKYKQKNANNSFLDLK